MCMHVTHEPRGMSLLSSQIEKHNMAHFLLGSMCQVEQNAAAAATAAAQRASRPPSLGGPRFEVWFGATIKECTLLLVG